MFYFVFEGNFPSTRPRGAYIGRSDFTEGFLCYEFGGTYTWRDFFSEFYGSFSMAFKYGRILAVSKAHLLEIWNEILVNLLVSASNELGKVWEETEEENLVPVVKIVKGTGEDSGRGSVKFEEGFLPFTQAFPSLIGFL